MIRAACKRADGSRVLQLILGTESLTQLLVGQPILVNLSHLAPDAVVPQTDLLIEFAPDFARTLAEFTTRAVADGARVCVEGAAPGRPQ